MGRKKKEGAIKSGQLQDNLVRYTFVVNKEQLKQITEEAASKSLTIKQLMSDIIKFYFSVQNESRAQSPLKQSRNKVTMANKDKLRAYLIQGKTPEK